MGRRARFHVEVGDLFVRQDLPQVVWRAIRAIPTAEGIKHALLERRDQPDTRKLLSYAILSDRRRFRRAGHEPPVPSTAEDLFGTDPRSTLEEVG